MQHFVDIDQLSITRNLLTAPVCVCAVISICVEGGHECPMHIILFTRTHCRSTCAPFERCSRAHLSASSCPHILLCNNLLLPHPAPCLTQEHLQRHVLRAWARVAGADHKVTLANRCRVCFMAGI